MKCPVHQRYSLKVIILENNKQKSCRNSALFFLLPSFSASRLIPRSPRLAHKARPVIQATLNQFSNLIQSTLAFWTPPYYDTPVIWAAPQYSGKTNYRSICFFSSLNPCSSLPSVVTYNRKQFQCLNIV